MSPKHFTGKTEDREDSLIVMDHAMMLRRNKEKEKQRQQEAIKYRRQQEFMEHLIQKRAQLRGDNESDLSSELSKGEEECYRQIEAMTQDGLQLK